MSSNAKSSTPVRRRAGRPSGSDREQNLRRILDAALVSFASKGYAGANFADIGKAVGFTRSALYQYFPNKQALYHALLEDIQGQHITAVQAIMADDGSFQEQLERILAVFVADHEFDFHRSTFLAATPMELKRHPELVEGSQVEDTVLSLLLDFFQQAIDTGEIVDRYSAEDLLLALLGGLLGMSLFQHSTGMGSVTRANDAILAMLGGRFLANADT